MAAIYSTKPIELHLPDTLTAEHVFQFSRVLEGCRGHDRVIVDMGSERFFAPFSMLFLAVRLKQFKRDNPGTHLILRSYKNHSYPAHMGFFKACDAEYGRDMGEADHSRQYIPVTRVHRSEFYEQPSDRFVELPDLIQRHVDRIADIITRGDLRHRELHDVISYSMREVFRNVFEHGNTDEIFYCAQYWLKSGKLEVGVADLGIGIRTGLGTNPNFRFPNDKEAIEASLLPGVSGRTHLPRTSSTWFNSGYGLYMTNRLARNGGNFVIASGKKAIILTSKTKNNYDVSFAGTALRLNFDEQRVGQVQARLREFREDAKNISAMIRGAGNRPPSAMSLLLRKDYK